MLDNQLIGKKLQEARKNKGMTQESLANELGMLQCEVSNIENAKIGSGIDNLTKLSFICDYLEINLKNLLFERADLMSNKEKEMSRKKDIHIHISDDEYKDHLEEIKEDKMFFNQLQEAIKDERFHRILACINRYRTHPQSYRKEQHKIYTRKNAELGNEQDDNIIHIDFLSSDDIYNNILDEIIAWNNKDKIEEFHRNYIENCEKSSILYSPEKEQEELISTRVNAEMRLIYWDKIRLQEQKLVRKNIDEQKIKNPNDHFVILSYSQILRIAYFLYEQDFDFSDDWSMYNVMTRHITYPLKGDKTYPIIVFQSNTKSESFIVMLSPTDNEYILGKFDWPNKVND